MGLGPHASKKKLRIDKIAHTHREGERTEGTKNRAKVQKRATTNTKSGVFHFLLLLPYLYHETSIITPNFHPLILDLKLSMNTPSPPQTYREELSKTTPKLSSEMQLQTSWKLALNHLQNLWESTRKFICQLLPRTSQKWTKKAPGMTRNIS